MEHITSHGSNGSNGGHGGPTDELVFHSSPSATIGVELELPVLDHENGDLVPGAPRILNACAEEKLTGVGAELMQSMFEVRTTTPCANITELRDNLLPTLRRARNIASSMGYDFAMLGTHPFMRPNTSAVSASERFEGTLLKLAWMTYYRVAFGLHIHVGIKSGDQAVGVINTLMQYLPHLLAVSANSPFWQGVDAGLASCRTALYGLVPQAGVPVVFSRWKEFRVYYNLMRSCRGEYSLKDVKWDIRPRPDLGTLEFRICDMPGSLSTVFSLAALTRTLVIAAQRRLAERPIIRRGDRRRHWLTVENKWSASRYGMKAMYVRTPTGKRRALVDDLADLVGRLMPIAKESGDDRFLAKLASPDKLESGAEHQRQVYRQTGNWKASIEEMTGRLLQELDKMAPAAPRQPEPVMHQAG